MSTNLLSFDGRVAIVTGAGAGMGREHALLLGKRGATVVVNDLIATTADAVAKAIVDAGGNAIAVPGSVAERSVTDAIVQTAIDKFNRIDILVNNAGIDIAGEFPEVSTEQFSQMLGVHVHGSWNLSQAVWPHMVKQKYGRILLVSSAALYGMPQNAAYTVAKGALFGLSKALSFDGEPHGILVNALGPIANTGMTTEIVTEGPIFDLIEKKYPASAVSPVVAWLVHEDCKVTSQFISSYGRNFGRIFLAETRGVHCPDGGYTPETIRDRFDEAVDQEGFIVPQSCFEAVIALADMRAKV